MLIFLLHTPLSAGDIAIPIERSNNIKPISKLEVIALVTSTFTGRILAIRKHASYQFPDCHHVKFLSDQGELFSIKLACAYTQTVQLIKQ